MSGPALTSNQQLFGAQLAQDTGLDPNVVDAWLLNEQSGSAAQNYQARNFNDWLNVGITGSGSYGTANSVWDSPVSGANATAAWLKGQPIGQGGYTSTGYDPAASSIQAILNTAKQGPAAQINAIQTSGWAGGHPGTVTETAIPSLYNQITGGGVTVLPSTPASLTAAATAAANAPVGVSPSGSGSAPALQPNGYISQGGGGLFSFLGPLNPANAIAGVWDAILGDAKYAGLFILMLFLGGFLVTKGVSANGGPSPKMPKLVPVPV